MVCKLGSQLRVDAVLVYSIQSTGWDIAAGGTIPATILLIDIHTKKTYSNTDTIFRHAVRADIKRLTDNLFIKYASDIYKSFSNYETLFWDYIKNSDDEKAFQHYLKKFPKGIFAGVARLKIYR